MFRPRVLLFVLGVLAAILGTDSYSSTSASYPSSSYTSSSSSSYPSSSSPSSSYPSSSSPSTSYPSASYSSSSYQTPMAEASSYGYGYAAPTYPSYGVPAYGMPIYGGYGQGYGYGGYGQGQGYGGYGQGQGYGGYGYSSSSSYGYGGCGYTKVIEVLDSIFCQHGYRKRYSSTIYPTIDVVIDQLEYLLDYVFLQTVYDYLVAAQQALETIQDAVYANFEDSTLLKPYYEGYSDGQTEETSETGTSTSSTSASRTNVANKLATAASKLKVHETNARTFKTNRGLKMKEKGAQQHASSSSKTKTKNDVVKQRASDAVVDVTLVELEGASSKVVRAVPQRDEELVRTLQKRMAQLKRDVRSSTRKARGADYSDYSCTYLTPTNCDYGKYDELLYNLLERIWTVLDFLDQAAFETWMFMQEISCDTDDDRWALEEAAITFGSIVTSFYTMLEVAYDVEKMYELVELEYGDESSYYRAGGSSSSSQSQPQQQPMGTVSVQVPMIRRPMGAVNRPPASQGYSFAQYMSQSQPQTPASYSSYSNYPSYSQQQQYRVSRASVSHQPSVPATSHTVGTRTSAQNPTVLVLG